MRIGVPKEIKTLEFRVGMTPAGVHEVVHDGHEVIVETNAGAGICVTDADYERAGAKVVGTAKEVFDLVKVEWMAEYDETQSIGRRYRRQDEIGTPFCVTVDFDSLEDGAVTVRERDSMSQERIPIEGLRRWLSDRLPAY